MVVSLPGEPEPRWARNFGTFGSNADLSSEMTVAYVKGFQGDQIDENSVHTMVKHFPGGLYLKQVIFQK